MTETKGLAAGLAEDIKSSWGLFLALFLIHIGLGVAGPVLNDIKGHFDLASAAAVSLVFSAFGLARLICDLPGGYLIQRVKQEKILVLGAAILLAGSVLVTLASTYELLLAGRVVAGTGSSLLNISALSILNLKATASNRGRTLSMYAAFSLCGSALGPGLGGIAASFFGWRGSFGASAVAAFLALACVASYLASSSRAPRGSVSGHENKSDSHRSAGDVPAPARSFLVGAFTANFSTFVLLFALEGFNNTIIPLYGSTVLGLGPGILGFTLGVMAIARFAVSFCGGILSDRYGRTAILIPCLLLAGTGTVMLRFAHSFTVFFAVCIVFALGRMANNVNLALLGDVTPREKMGMMIGVNRFLADLGLTAGPWAMGMVADKWGFQAAGLAAGVAAWAMALLIWKVFGYRQGRAGQAGSRS